MIKELIVGNPSGGLVTRPSARIDIYANQDGAILPIGCDSAWNEKIE